MNAKIIHFVAIVGIASSREYDQALILDNSFGNYGNWGDIELCADGSYVTGAEVRYQAPNNLDETAINSIKLYCQTDDLILTGFVTSTQGSRGRWYGYQGCTQGFVTGFKAQVLGYQGPLRDDVAVQDFNIMCDYGHETIDVLPGEPEWPNSENQPQLLAFRKGTWSNVQNCDYNRRVCGLQVRFEDTSIGDDTAVSDVILFCCQ